MAKKLTPMMAQYMEIKAKHPDCFLFYRLGDFYEMFNEDAVEGSKLLGITLTARHKGPNETPMCGMPFHSAEGYIAKLTKLGKKVAICEQVSDPSAPGIVQREVVRIVTPGTSFNETVLADNANQYVMSLEVKGGVFSLAAADVTTGEFIVTELSGADELVAEVLRLRPSEVVVDYSDLEDVQNLLKVCDFLHVFSHEYYRDPVTDVQKHFNVHSLEGFGIAGKDDVVKAAARVLDYLNHTQKTDLSHIRGIRFYTTQDFMPLDEATLRNLELFETLRDHQKEGSLFNVLDRTVTSMGGRMLTRWVLHPLVDQAAINARLDAVDECVRKSAMRDDLRVALKGVMDIERLLGRLTVNSGNARDLVGLARSLGELPGVEGALEGVESVRLGQLRQRLDLCEDVVELIERAIMDEPVASLRDGGMIREGFSAELDELRSISREGKSFIQSLQQQEIARTGISSLKVKFNKVFGYYLEVSKSNLASVPDDYIRKQTLVNAERFITPELKEYEEKVLGAEDKIKALEYDLFGKVRAEVLAHIERLQQVARVVAQVDVLAALAETAVRNRYVKPEMHLEGDLEIQAGRHPVVETMSFSGDFVPNDVVLGGERETIGLITGPNMGGKSTFLRQVALIVLMAHVGSFVPAEKARVSVVDRIFTRVGAADNLVKGQSTFMVEMQEAAFILNNATEKSLVILDEIGRGTSTYDGVSIAWAITEYLHNQIKAKTLFATHYHELVALAEELPNAANFSIAVRESAERGVIFLYKIVPGGVDKSYGIEVAKLAGLPSGVIGKAKEVLGGLEAKATPEATNQMTMFSEVEREARPLEKATPHPVVEALKEVDVNGMTPMEALQWVDTWKRNSS